MHEEFVLQDQLSENSETLQWQPYIMCNTWNLVCPYLLLLERMAGVALREKVLKEAHVL